MGLYLGELKTGVEGLKVGFYGIYVYIQKRLEDEVTCTPNSQSQSQMNEPVFYWY